MRKLGRTSSDALELLLDTVCSMFGAILLIAILVALMAQTVKVESSSDKASAEMLRRKIATAEADLAETHRLTEQVSAPADSPAAALAAEKEKIDQALAAARAQRDRMSGQLQDQVTEQTVDYSSEWKRLTANLRSLERKQEEINNAIKSQNQNTARLNGRTTEISQQIQKEKDARLVTLRFPKERARLKRTLSVICKFGKIYPVIDSDGHKNNTSIAWKDKGADSELSLPIETLGWEPAKDREAISSFLRKAPKEQYYLAFYVYPDSFEAFRFIRDHAVAEQWDFGFELERPGDELLWGSRGSSPPPL